MGKKIELPEVEPVHLKPFHGIRPGAIILCGLAGAVLLLFFIICMLPGILSNGSYVSFDINTRNTAVYIDGKYLGSTEGSVYFVPSGHHEFSFSILGADADFFGLLQGEYIFQFRQAQTARMLVGQDEQLVVRVLVYSLRQAFLQALA